MYRTFITIIPDYKPGDMPPEGYLQWHAWADVQIGAGLKQETCGMCGLWHFPQEMSGKIIESESRYRNGRKKIERSPVCLNCDNK